MQAGIEGFKVSGAGARSSRWGLAGSPLGAAPLGAGILRQLVACHKVPPRASPSHAAPCFSRLRPRQVDKALLAGNRNTATGREIPAAQGPGAERDYLYLDT